MNENAFVGMKVSLFHGNIKYKKLLCTVNPPCPFFGDFVVLPFSCLSFWFSMGPLGSGRCTWGAFEGLCQELEWSLYKLAFNATPVSPCAIIGKPVSSLLWSIGLQSRLLPARRGAYKDLLGGCDAPFQSGSWIRPPPPPPATHTLTTETETACNLKAARLQWQRTGQTQESDTPAFSGITAELSWWTERGGKMSQHSLSLSLV